LQRLLADAPGWEILVAIDVPGTERTWPRMGLVVRRDEIIDNLRRDVLPEPYRSLSF
jgi:hypothetical protein